MDKKLTLSLSETVIDKAKVYAKSQQISLSKLIEAYLGTLTSETEKDNEVKITPLVESISGVIDLPADFDYKKARGAYLMEKYK